PVIEALRAIRLRVVHAHGSAGPIAVTISSPGRSDGKSLIASNLALAFADRGYRTLPVDGDVRGGAPHRVLKTARKPGLTVLRTGFSDREQAEAKLDVLARLPIRVLGAVLNDVRLGGEYRYYSYYMAGYEAEDEHPAWDDRPVLQPSD